MDHGNSARIVDDMHDALARGDVEGVLALFTADATIESYLVVKVFRREEGVCRGHSEIRELIGALAERGVPWGGHATPIVRGNTIVVEYTSASSATDTFSVDVIELKNGKIHSLRAYAGWRAVTALTGEARE